MYWGKTFIFSGAKCVSDKTHFKNIISFVMFIVMTLLKYFPIFCDIIVMVHTFKKCDDLEGFVLHIMQEIK